MMRYKVLAVTSDESLRLELKNRLSQFDNIALVGFAAADASLHSKILGYTPHAVLLSHQDHNPETFHIAENIYQSFPGCAVVMLADQVDIETVRLAMQSGIREVIARDDIAELENTLLKAAQLEQSRAAGNRPDPRVVAFFGGRGGAGRTTLAINAAAALAQTGQRTILIDLNLYFGDAALLLNIKAKDTLSELVQEKSSFGIDDIRSFSMQHPAGFGVLCAPSSPEHAEYVTSHHVELLVNQLRPYYDFIILDLPCDLSDTTLTAIEAADEIKLVLRRDLTSLRSTRQILELLRTLRLAEKAELILNMDHKSVLLAKDMENVLEMTFASVIPEDQKTARICQERGVPFVLDQGSRPIAKAVKRMVRGWIERGGKS